MSSGRMPGEMPYWLRVVIKALSYAILLALALAMFIPFLWSLSTSLKSAGDVHQFPPQFIPDEPTLQAYRTVLTDVPFPRWFMNSFLIALVVTMANLAFCSMGGYALARIKFPGRKVIFTVILATMMIPAQITMIPVFRILQGIGLVNTYGGLIVPFMVNTFGIFLMKQFFESVPTELEEAAMLDGCSRFRIFWNIILPLARPALAALTIFAFLGNWNSFMMPLIIVSDPALSTLPLGLAMFRGEYFTDWPVLMAASVLIIAPVAFLYLFLQRYFVEGIAHTGLKG